MERRIIVGIEIVVFLVFFLFVLIVHHCYSQSLSFSSTEPSQHTISLFSPLLFAVARTHIKEGANMNKRHAIIKKRAKNKAKLGVFKGRGAVRTLAIFRILVDTGPLSIGDIQRKLKRIRSIETTYYASLYKRIHALVHAGYIEEVKPATDQAVGFKVCRYDVCTKFYVAYYLNGKSLEEIIRILNEPNAAIILAELINAEIAEA